MRFAARMPRAARCNVWKNQQLLSPVTWACRKKGQGKISGKSKTAEAIRYALTRHEALELSTDRLQSKYTG